MRQLEWLCNEKGYLKCMCEQFKYKICLNKIWSKCFLYTVIVQFTLAGGLLEYATPAGARNLKEM